MHRSTQKGMTLIELMIVIAIIAILGAIGYPTVNKYLQKSRRTEAKGVLADLAIRQERWRAENTSYASLVQLNSITPVQADPSDTDYTYTVTSGTNTFTLTATVVSGGAQDGDKGKDGTACTPLTLNQSDQKSPDDCW